MRVVDLLIVRPGSVDSRVRSRHGDFDRWFCRALGMTASEVEVIDPTVDRLPESPAGRTVLVTGSHASAYDDSPWIGRLESFLRRVEGAMLGVCFGHQVIATAFGGRVQRHPAGAELGTVEIERRPGAANDSLLAGLPRRFLAQSAHEDHVVQLPPGAEILAGNAHCAIQAFRLGSRIHGVQFHPEITPEIMSSNVGLRWQDGLLSEADHHRLSEGIEATPQAARILDSFLDLSPLVGSDFEEGLQQP